MAAYDPSRRIKTRRSLQKTGALVIALVAALWLAGLRVGAAPALQEAPTSPLFVPISPLLGADLPNLEGTVVDANNSAALSGIEVTAYQREAESWRPMRRTTTNAAGFYRFPRMPAGVYRLLAEDPDDAYAPRYYPEASLVEQASNVAVVAETVSGVELTLVPGGTISGTVAWTDGPAPFYAEVTLFRWRETAGAAPAEVVNGALAANWDSVASAEDYAADATNVFDFGFRGLPGGIYRVCASATSVQEDRSECYADALLGRTATDIPLDAGATVTGIDIDLGESAETVAMTGRVTTADGTPAAGVEVIVVAEGTADFGPLASGEQTSTDANGVYTFTRLLPGAYTVMFNDLDEQRYLPLSYIDETNPAAPGVLTLAAGEQRTVDAVVAPAGIISGYITLDGEIPGLNGQVYPYRLTDTEVTPLNLVNIDPATGAFRIGGLTEGTYVLQVLLQSVGANFSLFDGGEEPTQATPYVLTPGQQITDVAIDAAAAYDLLPFGQITGTVTLDGAPQPGLRVEFYRAPDRNRVPPPTVVVETDAAGAYRAVNLPPGEYLVGFVDPNGVYATLYYPNQPVLSLAQALTIGVPDPERPNRAFAFGNVDATLTPAGAIARTAQRGDGTPLVGAEVVLLRNLGDQGFARFGSTRTDAEGIYRFNGLLPGSYRACIDAPGVASQDCTDVGVSGQSFTINVLAGVASSGVDTVNVP